MAVLQPAPNFDLGSAEKQLHSYRTWLEAHPYESEKCIVDMLKSLQALCPLIGMYDGRKYPVSQKWEFQIQGVVRADFVAGNSLTGEFVFVEFEGAEKIAYLALQAPSSSAIGAIRYSTGLAK